MKNQIVKELTKSRAFIAYVILAALAVSGFFCDAKNPSVFAPKLLDPTLLPDVDAPQFSNIRPVNGIGALNSNVLSFSIADPAGSNGANPSGVDVSTVTVKTALGANLSLTANGLNFTGSLANLLDGPVNLTFTGKDKAGNTGTAGSNFTLKRIGPLIDFTTTPPATQTSSNSSETYTIAGKITDNFFNTAQLQITQPGNDGTCGTSDDVLWPVGSAGGQISGNVYDLSPQVKSNSGNFSVSFTAYNGVASGGSPRIAVYCGAATASDLAKDETGANKPNVTARMWRTDLTWTSIPVVPPPPPPPPPTFTLTLTPTCQHFINFSTVYLDASTSPIQVNAAYQASVTGPQGGLQGSGQFAGNLDAQGHVFLQANINFFGTYTWSITVGTQTATTQKVVNGTSC